MITSEQQLAARNAAAGKWVKVKLGCWWPALRGGTGAMMCHVVEACDFNAGSSVTIESLIESGYRVEVVA